MIIKTILAGVIVGAISFSITYAAGSIAGVIVSRRFKRDVDKINAESMAEFEKMIPRGYWIEKDGGLICSRCETEFSGDICNANKTRKGRPYCCPECGALMDEWAIGEE